MAPARVALAALVAAAAVSSAAAAALPHLVYFLVDDFGWADVGFHRAPGFNETVTPNFEALVAEGVELTQAYVHKYCSPTRSSIQSGRLPYHVNVLNDDMNIHNTNDLVSGYAGIPRNMTGMAEHLKRAGYATHFAGKWDAGMATAEHTPKGRGYDTGLNYFHHANDYWTSVDDSLCDKTVSIVDLWATDGPAYGKNNSWLCTQANQAAGCKYEDEIFVEEVLQRITEHNASTPFMLFWAPHIVHAPLQVPKAYLDKFAWITRSSRQFYMAMVNYLDTLLGRVVAALKAKGMWENLLLLSTADNGGPIYSNGTAGANNWPLRGGKMSNWQGGINVNAFASGGLLPDAVRGTKIDGFFHGCDAYATFAALAGVDPTDTKAAAAGLPPIDSLDMWPMISGANLTSPRTEIVAGSDAVECNVGTGTQVQALIRADGYKLIIGMLDQNIWTGPYYPNASTWQDPPYHCGVPTTPPTGKGGCLFNVFTDPTEHDDVAAQHPDIVASLYARLLELQTTAFTPDRGTDDGAACTAAMAYGGFWGPFV